MIAEWFKYAKTQEAALDTKKFSEIFAERIKEIDQELGDSSIDIMTDTIKEICKFPSEFTASKIEKLESPLDLVLSNAMLSQNLSEEEAEKMKDFFHYVLDAFKYYVSKQQSGEIDKG